MLINRKKISLLILTLSTISTSFSQSSKIADQIQVKWRVADTYNGKDNLGMKLVIKNVSQEQVTLSNYDIWFNSMFPVLNRKTPKYEFLDHTGNLFSLSFSSVSLNPSDSIMVDYESKYPIPNQSTTPNGFYIQDKVNKDSYAALKNVVYQPISLSNKDNNNFFEALYNKNLVLGKNVDVSPIFPTPKQIKVSKGKLTLPEETSYYISSSLGNGEKLLKEFSQTRRTVSSNESNQAFIKILKNESLGAEAYKLNVGKKGIQIECATEAGAFYAIKSLLSTIKIESSSQVPYMEVFDEPRYGYRGFMLDIARNFKDKSTILKYLDLMAAYKLNVFHFHFIDDEGWRIEIPSLPELTEVGAKRSPTFSNGLSIQPAYGSGAETTKNEYLSKQDFIEILKYANDRHIKVVPEIETPGHARASVKAMEYRYNRFMKEGKRFEAEQYLLHDIDDKSIYNTAQNWTDNVLNPALPSVYSFMEVVIDDFVDMYKEAGVKFDKVSIGGDEVPSGVWEKSPKIQQLMKDHNLSHVNDVWTYYISRMNDICLRKGLQMAGWEEIGMVNKGKGMVVNPDMANKQNMQVDVWNNVIGGGQEDLVYRLANAGYPTVFISASNMYFDMMWNTNYQEPGLKWATYADLYHSYSLLPEDFFANIDTYYSGKPLGKAKFASKVRLTEKGKANLIGLKGGLWAETVHDEKKLDYMVFPRFFALAEKAWSPKRNYEGESVFSAEKFNRDYNHFVHRIAQYELPRVSKNVDFRLPAVGVKYEKGKLFANTEYPGFTIYYSLDGRVPTLDSPKYGKGPIKNIGPHVIISFAVIDDKGNVGQVSYFKK